jgi:hypothetical protein
VPVSVGVFTHAHILLSLSLSLFLCLGLRASGFPCCLQVFVNIPFVNVSHLMSAAKQSMAGLPEEYKVSPESPQTIGEFVETETQRGVESIEICHTPDFWLSNWEEMIRGRSYIDVLAH